jgi:hypothetical protein
MLRGQIVMRQDSLYYLPKCRKDVKMKPDAKGQLMLPGMEESQEFLREHGPKMSPVARRAVERLILDSVAKAKKGG